MKLEFITKQDLEQFKSEITEIVTSLNKNTKPKTWLRSREVRDMLGISPGTLQNMRINRLVPFSKIGGTLFYEYDELVKVLNDNKRTS